MNAPVELDDIVFAEMVWAASKALLSGIAILIVVAAFGLVEVRYILWLPPLVFLVGLAFGAMGLEQREQVSAQGGSVHARQAAQMRSESDHSRTSIECPEGRIVSIRQLTCDGIQG